MGLGVVLLISPGAAVVHKCSCKLAKGPQSPPPGPPFLKALFRAVEWSIACPEHPLSAIGGPYLGPLSPIMRLPAYLQVMQVRSGPAAGLWA